MNPSFISILKATKEDRQGLFNATANRLGVPIQNIEKDFWVCLVLDLLFNYREHNTPRLLFKGGTSLSKAHSLISRFSEDIDITIFREDLDLSMSLDDLEGLSGKQQRKYFEKIKSASQSYISQELKPFLQNRFNSVFKEGSAPAVELDLSDDSGQTLLIKYQSLTQENSYILPAVKIECGAKSALDPNQFMTIKPYIADDVQQISLVVDNVVTICPERTFWDKIIILHGIRRWFDIKGTLRQNGHRYSRHYYDVYKLLNSNIGKNIVEKKHLAIDCARHAQIFFNSAALDLKSAYIGTFSIVPSGAMIKDLKRDYEAMSGMIFGQVPKFEEVIDALETFAHYLNQE
jgi:predicted nucleotidyltransferase component of viral defense system